LGAAVLYDLLSGPKGSPRENDKDYAAATNPYFGSAGAVVNANSSCGALATGIGFGQAQVLGAIPSGGFYDDYTPGVTKPDGTASADSTYMYIGGGKSTANVGGAAPNVPYTAGFGIGGAGNGGSRDGGAGPAFTGFIVKAVTAAAGVANGAVVETGFVNRSGVAMVTGQSVFGSASAASATVA